MTAERPGRRAAAVSVVAFVCCALLSTGWLAIGVVAAVVHHSPDLARRLAAEAVEGHDWALGLLAGAPRTEPLYQLVPDTALSVLVLALGAALLVSGVHDPTRSLLAIALAASAAAFNLQSSAASQALAMVTDLDRVDLVPRFVLPVATCVAYVFAMARTPPGRPGPRAGRPGWWVGVEAAGVAVVAVVVGLVYPVSVRCVLLVGLVLPLVGIVGTRRSYRAANSERLRAPARLLFGVLVATVVVEAALAVVTGVLVGLGLPGLPVIDPTAVGVGASFPSMPQVVLSLWAAHLSLPVLAVAVLWTGRRSGAVGAQRWFSRSLVVVLVTASVGCLYVVVDTVASRGAAPVVAESAAVAVCALVFLPAFLVAERVADRLLYGTRPAPYSVLAELAAQPRLASGGVPDLAGIAEVVGRGLGATTCRLTVHRPGLRDRSYSWVRPGEEEAETFLEIPSLHGGQEVGTVAIDRAAVAGADDQRQDLLEAIANSLGVVLEAARVSIDLERQLRAALAHAAEIADARRRAVAEADSERRRLERDLHDGVQHHLVSLSMTLGLTEFEVGAGRLGEARARLDQVFEQLGTAETVLARTATGLSAPALGERGVVAALCAEFDGDPHVRVDSTRVTVPRFAPEVEAAVYFCCLEAVSNARKHAPGAPVRLRLSTERERLYVTVRDEGPGWETRAGSGADGRGLRNMAARIAAVGGQLQVRTSPGRGTSVEGWVPLAALAVDRPVAVAAGDPGSPSG